MTMVEDPDKQNPDSPPDSTTAAPAQVDRLSLSEYRDRLFQLASEVASDKRWSEWRLAVDLPAMAAFVLVMTLLLAPPGSGHIEIPDLDSVAASTIRAERDLLIQDEKATELRRKAALAVVPAIYDYDSELYFALGDRVLNAMVTLADRRGGNDLSIAERRERFEADLKAPVSAGVFKLIEGLSEPVDVAIAINFFLNMGLERMIVADRASLPRGRTLEIRDSVVGSRLTLPSTGGIVDLRQLRRLMSARAGDAPYGSARIVRSWILETAKDLARPNLQANAVATDQMQRTAAAAAEPVFMRITAGEVLVRRGDRVGAGVRERIRLLNEHAESRTVWGETLAVAALLAGIMLLAAVFFSRSRGAHDFGRKQVYLTLAVCGITVLLSIGMFYAGLGLAEGAGVDAGMAAYFVPLALATGLIALMVDSRTSLLAGIGLTLFIAHRVNGDLALVTYYIVGVLAAGVAARHSRRRFDLLRTGLAVALAQVAVVPVATLLAGQQIGIDLLPYLAAAFISGCLIGVIMLGLLPVLEFLFDEVTDPRLVELASADHPLLKELALKAPGTYYHATMVATLAEAGADAIGANGLMCRVMGLYHDIGKIKRPLYFSENQRAGDNIHDRLAPQVSARVIFGHVLDGIEMARKARLGRVIIDGIAQHQGTTLLRGFYEKARAQGYNGPEEDYRYPGPRPNRRETGILLLADAIEASTRALKDPSAGMVRERVHQIVSARIADNQLDDCDLTMQEVATLEETFARTLSLGVFHNRIDYPPLRGSGGDAGGKDAAGNYRIHSLPGLANRSA